MTSLNSINRTSPARNARHSIGAFTLIETLVAAVVVLISMGAIFLASSRCISMINSAHDIALASAMLHERMQQLQSTAWETLSDSDSFTDQVWTDPEDGTTENMDGLLKNAPKAGGVLQARGAVESIRISAYRPAPIATPEAAAITATRQANSAILTSGETNLVDENILRIDLRLTWTDGRMALQRSLASSAIVARK